MVFLSTAGYADTNLKFVATIEQAVKDALRARPGGAVFTTPTLCDSILERLTDPNSTFDWRRAFQQSKGEFLSYAASADEVIARLTSQAADASTRTHLLGRVAQVMERNNFVALDSPARVKQWLKEVIEENKLPWLLVIWDEFTEFFLSGAPLDGLQDMAELSYGAPFYLLITTHRSPDTMGLTRTDRWKKLQDRFVMCPFQMETVTTYSLMGNVIRVNPELELLWEDTQASLWDKVRFTAPILAREDGRQNELKRLVPLHPYSAYLLSTLAAASLSAANRTLFQFLKGDSPHGYRHFLDEHPGHGSWAFYTADGLWDYFFQRDSLELADEFRDAVSYYYSRCDDAEGPDEQRAFKATMLLIALQHAVAREPRLAPTLSNLGHLFSGTPLESEIDRTMQALCRKDLVREVPGENQDRRQYTIPRGGVDIGEIRRIKGALPDFRKQLEAGGELRSQVAPTLRLSGAMDRRYAMSLTSVEELLTRRERVAAQPKRYEVAVVWVVPLTAQQHAEAGRVLPDLASKDEQVIYALIDEPFGQDRFDLYQEDCAYLQYYSSKISDPQNARYYRKRAADRVRSWLESLRTSTISVFAGSSHRLVSGFASFVEAFGDVVRRLYPYGPEQLSLSAPLYRESFGVSGGEIGLGTKEPSSEYIALVEALKTESLWPQSGGLARQRLAARPDHPLTRMQQVVEAALAADSVDLAELWARLQSPPFGLLPAPIGIALLGLLLRDTKEGYYYGDGTNTWPLDATKLASLLNEVVKGRSGTVLYRTSAAAKAFCELVRLIFRLPSTVENYPDNVRLALREHLKRLGFPLWALNYDIGAGGRAPLRSIVLLHQVVSSREATGASLSQECLEQVAQALQKDKSLLYQVVTVSRFEQGMRTLVDGQDPGLLSLAERVGTGLRGVLNCIHAQLNEEVWLWQERDVIERLPAVRSEFELIEALNGITGAAASDLDGATAAVQDLLRAGKLPLLVLADHESRDVAAALSALQQFLQSGRRYSHLAQLVTALSVASEPIAAALRHPVEALDRWIRRRHRQELAADDVEAVYGGIRDLSGIVLEEELRREIARVLTELASTRLARELGTMWHSVTGTASPDDWTATHGVPVRWLLEDAGWADLLAVIAEPRSVSVSRLEWAIGQLRDRQEPLRALLNDQASVEALLRVAVGEYRALVQSKEDLQALRTHLRSHAGGDVRQWERKRVEEAGRDWVQKSYTERFYPRAATLVDQMPEAEIRAQLKQLVRYPAVGLRLVARKA